MKNVLTDACTLKIENFEGPLSLLFHLIEKNKMDIYDIRISEITDQYMEYLFTAQELNLNIASEFIVMAATLLQIKSKLILPQIKEQEISCEDDNTNASEDQLIMKLAEYKKIKQMAGLLKKREEIYSKMLYRSWLNFDFKPMQAKVSGTKEQLINLHVDLVKRYKSRFKNELASNIGCILKREVFSVKAKIKYVLNIIATKRTFNFSEIIKKGRICKNEIIANFLAVLELVKLKKVRVYQKDAFDDICVSAYELGVIEETHETQKTS